MAKVERVLVVVDPTAATQPGLERAVWLARRLKWKLELLICMHGGLPARHLKGAESREARRTLLSHQLGYLKSLAAGFRDLDIEVKAVWDRPLHEAIIRETLRYEPRIVMKDTHFHPAISRALITNTDWLLIRDCPAPLWLVRATTWPERPVVIACVDPLHTHDKTAALDRRILAEAQQMAEHLCGQVHVLHSYDSALLIAGASNVPGTPIEVEAIAAELQAEHAAALTRLATSLGLTSKQTHFRSAPPAEAIVALTRQLKANLVVIGAVARSRVARPFIGSTAERVLDRLPSDVLVIKPAEFQSVVTYRAQPVDFIAMP